MTRKKYPKTQEEAFAIIDAMLPDEDKKEALKIRDDEEFASEQHFFGLGIWVRNNWIYGGKVDYNVLTGESSDLKPGEAMSDAFFLRMSPDDLSSRFLSLYHKHLRETFK